ncbi:autotransporter assembly complex family protein [Phenylobacterium terrae]|uniref:Autotransporter assembly complex family protein n=1 Tax=Phenylobacterium terrae TaxID=2665495 RepID=A0ABW4N5A0_9CAUL
MAQSPRATIEGELDEELRAAIAQAIGETERPIQNRFDARRRAREAAEDAIAVLRSEGYYAHEVEADLTDTEPPVPVVRVAPGPRFVVAEPRVEWVGEPPQPEVREAAEESLLLEPGAPGRAADVLAAEGRAVAAVQKSGYADVAAAPREVIVDYADSTLRPTFRINSGDLVRLDGLKLVTEGRTNPVWVQRLAPWREGEPYDPEDVAELERRLLDTGVYESVTVALAPKEQTTPEGLRPIVVSLADRERRTLELGASYSTTDGAGLEARWTRYNVLGRADTLELLGRLSSIDSRAGAELSLPHWRQAQQTLRLGGAVYQVKTDAYDETGAGVHVDVTRRYGKTSYLTVGATLDLSRTDELRRGTLSPLGRDLVTATLLGALALDRSDDPLDPKRGWRIEARGEPTLITGEDTLPYLKLQTQGTMYYPLDDEGRTVVAGRLRVGTMVGGSIPEVPASRRFYAGGGGSVRGYAYQAVGPRLEDNTPQGGISLLETSIEVRRKLFGRWGMAAFVDGGAVGTDPFPAGKDFSLGAGLGLRYDLGFGPIRVDIAVPLDRRTSDAPFQVYLSIGQSF